MSPTPTDPNQAQAWITGDPPDQTIDFYIPRGNTGPMGPVGPQGPSLVVGAVETNMGPAAPGTVGPQGLTGPKGDPGGMVLGTQIATNTDWNTLTADGIYRISGQTGQTNAPIIPYGILYVNNVEAVGVRLVQTFYPDTVATGGRTIYQRAYAGGIWQPWRSFNATRIDNTAGRAIYHWDNTADREQLIYGDTGWRSIALDSTYGIAAAGNFFGGANGVALAADAVKIRRIGNQVYIGGNGVVQPKQDYSSTTRSLVLLPNGFRSNGANDFIITRYGNNGGDANQRLVMLTIPADYTAALSPINAVPLIDSNWNNHAAGSGWPKTYGGIWLWGSWVTNETWPTALPGIANGTIPNA